MWWFTIIVVSVAICVMICIFSMIIGFCCRNYQGLIFGIYAPPSKPATKLPFDSKEQNPPERVILCTKGSKIGITNYFYNDKQNKTLIYFHGNGTDHNHDKDLIINLRRILKCNIFYVEYRGYGENQGYPKEKFLQEDGRSVVDHIRENISINQTEVYLFGVSLGGALLIHLLKYIEEDLFVKGIIIQNTFTSIDELIEAKVPSPLMSVFKLIQKEKWDNIIALQNFKGRRRDLRWLLLTSKHDKQIPAEEMMRDLHGMLIQNNSDFRRVEHWGLEKGHNNIVKDREYYRKLSEFMYNN